MIVFREARKINSSRNFRHDVPTFQPICCCSRLNAALFTFYDGGKHVEVGGGGCGDDNDGVQRP